MRLLEETFINFGIPGIHNENIVDSSSIYYSPLVSSTWKNIA